MSVSFKIGDVSKKLVLFYLRLTDVKENQNNISIVDSQITVGTVCKKLADQSGVLDMFLVFVFLTCTALFSSLAIGFPTYVSAAATAGVIVLALGDAAEKSFTVSFKKDLSDHLTISDAAFSMQYAIVSTGRALAGFASRSLLFKASMSTALSVVFLYVWAATFSVTASNLSFFQLSYFIAIQPQTYANLLIDFLILLFVVRTFRWFAKICEASSKSLVLSLVFLLYFCVIVTIATYMFWISLTLGVLLGGLVNGQFDFETLRLFPEFFRLQVLSFDVPRRTAQIIFDMKFGEPIKMIVGSNDQPDFLQINYLNLMRVYYFSTFLLPLLISLLTASISFAPLVFGVLSRVGTSGTDYDPNFHPFNALALSVAIPVTFGVFFTILVLA